MLADTIRQVLEERYVGQLINGQSIYNVQQSLMHCLYGQLKQGIFNQLDFDVMVDDEDKTKIAIRPNNLISALCLVGIYPKSIPDQDIYFVKDGYYTFDPYSRILSFERETNDEAEVD